MKLPDLEYGPVQTVSGQLPRLDEAQRRAAATISEGLTRYGQELVKTETQTAAAELHAGLADVETNLSSKRYLTTQELRNALGSGFDSLPPEVRQRVTQKGIDTNTGEVSDLDRDDIPMYQVAGLIYDQKAKQLLQAAGQKVSMPGWRAEFEAQAQGDIFDRKVRIGRQQMKAMDDDLRSQQAVNVKTLTRAGSFDEAGAVVRSSNLFDPAEKERLIGEVEQERQLQPLNDRAIAGVQSVTDVVEAGKLIGRLETGEGLDRLEDKDRQQWKHHLQALVKDFEHEAKTSTANKMHAKDEEAWNQVLGAYRSAGGRPLSMNLVPPPGQISAGAQKSLIAFIEGTRPDKKPIETDLALYAGLTRMAGQAPADFKAVDLIPYVGRLSVAHFTHFADLQRTLKADPDGVKYQGFVGAQEETNRLLRGHGFRVDGKDAEDDAQPVGHVHSVVNTELFRETVRLKRDLALDERDKVISGVVAREVKARRWRRKDEVTSLGVEPTYVAPLRQAAGVLGRPQDGDGLKALQAEYVAAESTIESAWRRRSPRPLRPEQAVAVWTIMRRDQARIDAALQAAGKPVDDAYRALMATDYILGGGR